MTEYLSARGLGHDFEDLTAFDGLGISVQEGRTLGVVGPSGCGKSTLLEVICGLIQPSRGEIQVGNAVESPSRLQLCAFMPQRDCLLPWYSAIDNASLALLNQGISRREARASAHLLFERFGLVGFESARPEHLSGGMRQRVAFLRTLLSGKPLLLLDEPFASLDAITRAELQEWLAPSLLESGNTTVLVTHDVEEALYLADNVLVLSARPGRLIDLIDSPAGSASRLETVTSPEFQECREEIFGLLRSNA